VIRRPAQHPAPANYSLALALAGLVLIGPLVPAPAAETRTAAPEKVRSAAGEGASAQHKQRLQGEQRELRARLAQLKKQLAQSESAQSDAADALAASETAISAANRRLHDLAQARSQVAEQIGALQERQRSAQSRQSAQERAVGQLLRTLKSTDDRRPWQELVDGQTPGASARDQDGLDRLVHAGLRQVDELRQRREDLAELESQSRERKVELAAIAQEERASRAQLLHQQAERRTTLARLQKDIATQRRSVAVLERDESRLGSLIDEISKVLAEQARRRAAAAARAPGPAPGQPSQAPGLAAFDELRGRLQLPVSGELQSRFGAARRSDDGKLEPGAPSWKGLFIRAAAGSEVHAVAAGRVVFADWLRGFGNLMILDHGNGLLSVYGNNESLLHGVGDSVQAREVIAAVGNTGGSQDSGLYFELRYQGRPFDPLAWMAAR
jgi:septal ring factor EnvC (AmiA/AmiB activator)